MLQTVCPAEDFAQGLVIWQQEVKDGESGYIFFFHCSGKTPFLNDA